MIEILFSVKFRNILFVARVGMNLTSLLTLIAMFDGVRSEVPKVSYISFMDIWMTVCMIIIFTAIAEYSIAHALCRYKMKRKAILVDTISRWVVMMLFILFNLVYWPLLLNKGKIWEIMKPNHTNSTEK